VKALRFHVVASVVRVWVNKTSSAELTEAINSMFQWYKRAVVYYANLVDVDASETSTAELKTQILKAKWFARGRTLQEAIAPSEVLFFSRNWQLVGSKQNLINIAEIAQASRVPESVLLGDDPQRWPIADRMSRASNRRTTRVEDEAYSLFGLFDVNMVLTCGEGSKAFRRLVEEIFRTSDDETLSMLPLYREWTKSG
jgi:hypothetical protein